MSGSKLIALERARQIAREGYDASHDDQHVDRELVYAALCYASYTDSDISFQWWPWEQEWWKPSDDQIRNLVKSGALIAAEIDRLQRAEAKP